MYSSFVSSIPSAIGTRHLLYGSSVCERRVNHTAWWQHWQGRRAVKIDMTATSPSSTPPLSRHGKQPQRDTLYVDAASRRYPIIFDRDILSDGATFAPFLTGDKVVIVTNSTVAPLYLSRVQDAIATLPGVTVSSVILPDGEEYKDVSSLCRIWDECMRARLDRKSTLVALGGGVVGDVTGFAASTFVRGVSFIQIPTTLLAVVDSAVGGKTAINHPQGKNMIGAFYQPVAVLVDSVVLDTLDDRQLSAGIAEVVKYGLIQDWSFFEWCEAHMDELVQRKPDALRIAMRRSCEYKADVVARDETEGGVRAILNLGHTFGHAIEAGMGYGEWLHGEAVAAGMIMACEMSARLGWIERDVIERAERLLIRAALPIRPPPSMTLEKFMTYMSVDKKVESGVLRLVLLKEPGHAIVTKDFAESVLFDTIMHYHQLYKADAGAYENAAMNLPK